MRDGQARAPFVDMALGDLRLELEDNGCKRTAHVTRPWQVPTTKSAEEATLLGAQSVGEPAVGNIRPVW
jgi:hypothetical protein